MRDLQTWPVLEASVEYIRIQHFWPAGRWFSLGSCLNCSMAGVPLAAGILHSKYIQEVRSGFYWSASLPSFCQTVALPPSPHLLPRHLISGDISNRDIISCTDHSKPQFSELLVKKNPNTNHVQPRAKWKQHLSTSYKLTHLYSVIKIKTRRSQQQPANQHNPLTGEDR